MRIISDILWAHANATQRVFTGGRSKTVGASEIGQCARKRESYKALRETAIAAGSTSTNSALWVTPQTG